MIGLILVYSSRRRSGMDKVAFDDINWIRIGWSPDDEEIKFEEARCNQNSFYNISSKAYMSLYIQEDLQYREDF